MNELISRFELHDETIGSSFSRRYDYEKLNSATEEEFAKFYLETMKELWPEDNSALCCFECNRPIHGPTELRRYYGRNTHPKCFGATRKRDSAEQRERYEPNKEIKGYLDRVEKLDLCKLGF